MLGLEIARNRCYKIAKKIDKRENPKEYKNAMLMPLFFYLENSMEEALLKLFNGICRNDYVIPCKDIMQKIIEREESAEINRLKNNDIK